MKNRLIAALAALAAGVLLYLPAASAAPQPRTAPPEVVPAAVHRLSAAAGALTAGVPDRAQLDELHQQLRLELDRLDGPVGIDLTWWQTHYSDIIGYVYSPGTPISYPIAYDGDNEYYLHHDLYGNYSEYGTIFLDARVPSDFTAQNNVLYGHHMSDGSMFASISNYKQQWYYDAHPYYFLYTDRGNYRVDLFAGIIVPGEHEVFSSTLSADQLRRFINDSTFYSGRGVPSGQIMTLCTCSYEAANYRYVILGEMVPLADTPEETNS